MDHRHGAVAHAVHLVEAARFEARRHQEHVRSGFNEVRERLVEPDPHRDAIGNARGERLPHVLKTRLAGAEHDEGRVELRQLLECRPDQVEPLLGNHARHHADERPAPRSLVDG